MQTALVTYLPSASNCVEPSAEAASSGQGLKANSAIQSQRTSTEFTTILQKGKAVQMPQNTAPGGGVNDIPLIGMTDDTKKTGEDESVDVCSLLMQLMVMNSSVQADGGNGGGNNGTDEQAVHGILGVINENLDLSDSTLKGLENAASVILENGGKAASVLTALASSKSTAGGSSGQPNGDAAATQLDTVLAGITEALKNELAQTGAANGDVPAGQNEAILNTAADVSSQNALFSSGMKDKSAAAVLNTEAPITDGPDGLFQATSSAVDKAAEKAAGVVPAGGNDETGFGSLASRDKSKNDEAGTAGNGVSQALSGTDIKGETMAEKTTAVERALNKFTDDLRSIRSGNQEIRIVLEPERLGVLIISVIKTESGISAKIKSEDKEVAAIISDHLQKLVSSMQDKGITVDDVDVVYNQAGQNTSFTQQSFSQGREDSSKGYASPINKNDAESSNADVWQNFFGGETGGEMGGDGTVDYRI